MDFVFFGIQGSGKGTQAKKLAKDCGYDIFEAGGALRSIAATQTELGREVASYIDAGKLVPHTIIMKVVRRAIAQQPKDRAMIFDGVPRDAEQKKDFDAMMHEAGRSFGCIIFLLNESEARIRLTRRATIEGRTDDASEESIRRRMQLFQEKTMPIIDAYQRELPTKVASIQAAGDMQKVASDVRSAVTRLKEDCKDNK